MGYHYVPQEYLKGFQTADEPGLIWMYDKELRRFVKAAITAVAQQADYYDQEAERELSRSVEGPAHITLGKVRRRERLSGDDRLRLALYVGTMIMRVPARRRRAWELVPSALEDSMNEVRALINDWAQRTDADQPLVARRLTEVDAVQEKLYLEPPSSVTDQIRSPWPSERVLGCVYNMTWRIVSTDRRNCFLTSDNPASFFEGYGLGSAEAELTFPLSSDLALLANWQGPQRSLIILQGKPLIVREVNRRVASGAERFVFYHEERDWVAALANKPRPYLSRILW